MLFARKTTFAALASLTLTLATGPAARASIVVETESNGTSVNNTLATAQAIAASAFTSPAPANVYALANSGTATVTGFNGSNDVDFFSFTATAGSQAIFDIDNNPTGFNSILSLFDSAGTLIAFGDSTNPVDAGSASPVDAFIGTYTFTTSGTFYIAVSGNGNFANALLVAQQTALTRPDGNDGGFSVQNATIGDSGFTNNGPQPSTNLAYTLQISLQNQQVVPEPASVLMLGCSGVMGLVLVGVKRRRQATGL